MLTDCGGQRVKAFTGAAAHCRQDPQWQNPIATGFPTTWTSTAPQKQRPRYSRSVCIASFPGEAPEG